MSKCSRFSLNPANVKLFKAEIELEAIDNDLYRQKRIHLVNKANISLFKTFYLNCGKV